MGTSGGQALRIGDNVKEKECAQRQECVSYLLETLGKEMGEENVECAAFQNPDLGNTLCSSWSFYEGSVLCELTCARSSPDSIHSFIHSIIQSLNILVKCLWLIDSLIQSSENSHPLTIHTYCANFARIFKHFGGVILF